MNRRRRFRNLGHISARSLTCFFRAGSILLAMSKKDDMIAALENRQPAGAVPFWELAFYRWDIASGRHIVVGREFEALSPSKQDDALRANAEIILSVTEQMQFAAVTTPSGYWHQSPGQLAYYCLPGDARFRQVEVLRDMVPPDLMLVSVSGGVMGMPGSENYVEFCYKLFDAPEEIDEQARNGLANGLDNARRFRDCGTEAMITAGDFADNRGPFFNPDQMERFILPYMREWAEQVRAMDAYAIVHSDGNLMPCLNDIADTGIHAIQAIDPTAGMDMRTVKDRVGDRLCLCGNVDCGLLLTGTPETVYEAARNLLKTCKEGGGLVFGASNVVQDEAPAENYHAMIQAWIDHGRY